MKICAAQEVTKARLAIHEICDALSPQAKALWATIGPESLADYLPDAHVRPENNQGNVVSFSAARRRKG